MVKTKSTQKKEPLTRERICEYVWARYIDNTSPKFDVDEEEALQFFEDHYGRHPLDEECFFYGILLYERAFSDESNRARYLVKAKEVFEVYRNLSGETEWDVIEDRYADVCDLIESESLLEKVKTAAELAPRIEGMVLVPSGTFLYGPDMQEIFLEPFYIDVLPVTNAEYRRFLEDTQYRPPELWKNRPALADDDLPVTGVSWMDTLKYCNWAGKGLPTAEQWEKAARGPDGNTYPWGEEPPTPQRANFLDMGSGTAHLRRTDAYEAGKSPYGLYCMSGTVWEWTNTTYPEREAAQIVKGGCYVDPPQPEFLAAWAWNWAGKKEKNDLIGFRCTKRLEVG